MEASNNLIVIAIAVVIVVYLIVQGVIQWRQTGSITEALKFAFASMQNNPLIEQGIETIFGRLDDDERGVVRNLLNTLDPVTAFVAGDWDDKTVAYFRRLLDEVDGVSTPTLQDEIEKVRHNTGIDWGNGNDVTVMQQPLRVALNPNPTLRDNVNNTEWPGGRAKDVPGEYDISWQKVDENDLYGPPPEIHLKEDGLKIEVADRRGTLMIKQSVNEIVRAGQRYLLQMTGVAGLTRKEGYDQPVDEYAVISGRLLVGNRQIILPRGTLGSGDFEAQWVIETDRHHEVLAYIINIEIGNIDNVPFDSQSHVTIGKIALMAVDADYGDDSGPVTRF